MQDGSLPQALAEISTENYSMTYSSNLLPSPSPSSVGGAEAEITHTLSPSFRSIEGASRLCSVCACIKHLRNLTKRNAHLSMYFIIETKRSVDEMMDKSKGHRAHTF